MTVMEAKANIAQANAMLNLFILIKSSLPDDVVNGENSVLNAYANGVTWSKEYLKQANLLLEIAEFENKSVVVLVGEIC